MNFHRLIANTKAMPNGCLEWTGPRNSKGYGHTCDANHKPFYAHREFYRLVHGEFDSTLQVMHTCDNPPCVNPEHLKLGTNLDNHFDKVAKGRAYYGEPGKGSNVRLNWDIVRDIRSRYKAGSSIAILAKAYSVSHSGISHIVHNRSWKE